MPYSTDQQSQAQQTSSQYSGGAYGSPSDPTRPQLAAAANPYANLTPGQMQQTGQQIQDLQMQQGNLMGGYPTMANDYGLGTQVGPIPGSASNPAYGAQPVTVAVPDTSSRGFNPWSLTGEANARGK